MPHSHGCLHYFAHDFDWTLEALTRTHIQLECNGIQLFLAVSRKIRDLGQVRANQAVDVFVAAALLGTVRVAEVDRYADSRGGLSVSRHLPALVISHVLAHRQRHTRRFALAQSDNQLFAQFTDRQGIDRVIDRLATDAGFFKAGYVHAAQLAGNLLGRQMLTQHMGHQLEALTAW